MTCDLKNDANAGIELTMVAIQFSVDLADCEIKKLSPIKQVCFDLHAEISFCRR